MRWRRRVMAFNPVSSQQGRRLQSRCIICYSLMIEVLVFLSSMMQQCRQWKGCIGELSAVHVSWIIDALRPGSPMISDHLQHKMRSSTIWGQLKGQHLNQLEHSGWVKISKLAVLLSLNVINAIKQYCTRANWSGHKMRWSVDQIKTGHHNKDTDSWFKSVLICPTYTSPWFWI